MSAYDTIIIGAGMSGLAAGIRLARFDQRQMSADRISSVQFVRFPLGGLDSGEFLALAGSGKIAIELDHPKLVARAPVNGILAYALAQDLSE